MKRFNEVASRIGLDTAGVQMKKSPSTRTHVFSIAIEDYQSKAISSVQFAVNDADAFDAAWRALGVSPRDCVSLRSAGATKTTIESKFKTFLRGVSSDDSVVFFFAGHGAAINSESYLTAHDTQLNDLANTSIPLAWFLAELRSCESGRVTMFIDACHSGLPVSTAMRSMIGNMSGDDLRIFCQDAEHHMAFAACGVDERSYSAGALKHGLWSYALIEALTGRAKDALTKGALITGDSLRDFLALEVRRLARLHLSGGDVQTPCSFGNATKQFVVADLAELLSARASASTVAAKVFENAVFRGQEKGSIRSLSGFKRTHKVPDGHYEAANNFVRLVGAQEVEERANSLAEEIRSVFALKRKDMDVAIDAGSAMIIAPDFEVTVEINQDRSDVTQFSLSTEVAVRDLAILSNPAFVALFEEHCNKVLGRFRSPADVSALIDEIEGVPELASGLTYPPSGDSFALVISALRMRVHVSRSKASFQVIGLRDLRKLIDGVEAACEELARHSIVLPFRPV